MAKNKGLEIINPVLFLCLLGCGRRGTKKADRHGNLTLIGTSAIGRVQQRSELSKWRVKPRPTLVVRGI